MRFYLQRETRDRQVEPGKFDGILTGTDDRQARCRNLFQRPMEVMVIRECLYMFWIPSHKICHGAYCLDRVAYAAYKTVGSFYSRSGKWSFACQSV